MSADVAIKDAFIAVINVVKSHGLLLIVIHKVSTAPVLTAGKPIVSALENVVLNPIGNPLNHVKSNPIKKVWLIGVQYGQSFVICSFQISPSRNTAAISATPKELL